jgi:BirA family biotin operon repressor/biotin-[acetyl-CoA-carboxylase] ligase
MIKFNKTKKGWKVPLSATKYGIFTIEYDITDSTNERAKIYAKESWHGEPTLFIAEEQVQGRGRYSRRFYSKRGAGVYLSLLFKPNSDISNTTSIIALTAVSMIKAIREQVMADVKIKWVNDLVLGDKKLGGILIEGAINPQTKSYDYLIAGIGINLYITELDEEIQGIATSLEGETGVKIDKNELTRTFVSHFTKGIKSPDSEELFSNYSKHLVTIGKDVTVKTITEEYDATAIRINRDYSLTVITENGEEKRIYTGEASVKPSKK